MRLVCLSHSPLLLSVPSRLCEGFFAAVDALHREIVSAEPEVIVVFAPDHFNGFFYDIMPAFCLGCDAAGATDWDIEAGRLDVPRDLARAMAVAVQADGIDLAVSYRMTVDHGFTIPLRLLIKRLDAYPVIPIFVNCAAPPLPSCQRARLLGEAVGRFLCGAGKRAVIVGSGGLSHDPPHPGFDEASAEMRELLVAVKPWRPADEAARQNRVKKAAVELVAGTGPCLPPNPQWDRALLDLLHRQDLVAVDRFTDDRIAREGGSGGQEIRTWIAAFAALGAGGRYRSEELYYAAVPEWITGMAVVKAEI
jgi:2,3-dihydroxyphenylpropionate 1,2-dioxygenase